MGHPITDFRGQAFGTSDFKLELWLKLLSEMIGRDEMLPVWLEEARDHWAGAGSWGVGCIDAQLDRFLTDQERINIVEALAERSLRTLEAQGPILTCDFLNGLIAAGPESDFTKALDAEAFARVGRAFIGLIREQFDRDSKSVQWL